MQGNFLLQIADGADQDKTRNKKCVVCSYSERLHTTRDRLDKDILPQTAENVNRKDIEK